MRVLVQMVPIVRSSVDAARRSAAQLRACSPLNCYQRLPYATRPAARMRRVKRRGERKETVTDKDLYRAILSVLQSHFDSTELSRPASHAEFNDGAGEQLGRREPSHASSPDR